MLLAEIVPFAKPWPWTTTDVGFAPRKLSTVAPFTVLANETHGFIVNEKVAVFVLSVAETVLVPLFVSSTVIVPDASA